MLDKKTKNLKKGKKKVKVYSSDQKKSFPETSIIAQLKEKYDSIDPSKIQKFTELPLSRKTLKGLTENSYRILTDIQKETIGLALKGKDILGAAQTGSGKTLAFLIPILEALYCLQWTRMDGVGALVITPTRELAYQIFETIRKVGKYHDFSVGLIIGGKDLKFEKKRMNQCNIVICTPGRLLQHMDENPLFDCCTMKILVLDEADRCLDMGFQETMNAIIANLPPKRQTLLFSATQTKSIKDLARLSLKDPCYVSVHENLKHSTPEGLKQSYVVCELHEKVSIIWSFIRNHLKKKCIIFFSSCKQVKYMYEIFCKLRPGMSIMALYGTLHQMRRMDIYENFCRKQSAVLLATDLAARGLDFPEVHWVVQADCPEDSSTYIHRVGRTARYHRGGESLLLLLPSEEEAMLHELELKKVPINKIDVNPNKLQNPIRKMEAFLAKDPSLKDTAQRAFISYVKNVFLMKNKKIFKVDSLDIDSYSKSLGLAVAPRVRFLQRHNARIAKQKGDKLSQETREEQKIVPENNFELENDNEDENSDHDDILTVKRTNHEIELDEYDEPLEEIDQSGGKGGKVVSKAAVAKKLLKKKIVPNKKIIFDEDGEVVMSSTKDKRSEAAQEYENENVGGIDIERAKIVLQEEDKFDKELFREKVKAKKKEKKRKLKQMKRGDNQDDFGTDSEQEQQVALLTDPEDDEKVGEEQPEPEEEIKQKKPKKRKILDPETNKPKKKKLNVKEAASTLSVNEAEELALLLLNKNN